jgi:SSS family solute:Na+ symporter
VIAHGLWAGREERTTDDYFLAGRRLTWPFIGLSLYASNMSGASFVGLTGAAYEHGVVVFNYEWTAALVLILFAAFMLPVFLRARIATVPEYLERRFDRRARLLHSTFTILAVMLLDTAGALFVGGLLITILLPQLALWQASALLAAFAGAYTIMGGLKAVVMTDATQAVLMIIGAAMVFVIGLDAVGGWDALMTQMGPERLQLVKPAGDDFLPWHGIFGVVLLGFYYWTINQYFVQRTLAAASLEQGRMGALFGGLLKLPNLFLMILPGMIAFALYPDLGDPDLAFPKLAFELLPMGLRGLVLTALIAAIMSSLDSALNAVASLVTLDFVRPARPGLSERALLNIGRLTTLVATAVAAIYAPLIREFGSLFAYFQSTLAYVAPGLVAVYLAGLLWPRANAAGAIAALSLSVPIGLALFVAKEATGAWAALGLPDTHFTVMAALVFALALAILAAASLATAPDREATAFTARRADLAAASPAPRWHARFFVQSAALAALVVLPFLYFS